ncbi:MAG: hypothetical protein GY711_17135 [bacterium]|nr:hypothetical protein [bacterium]
MRGILVPIALALGVLPFVVSRPEPARAGTAVRMTLDESVAGADLVLEGRVLSKSCATASDGLIYTDYQVSVDRTFVGVDLPVRSVRLPGGMLPTGRGLMVPGVPELRVGEEVFLLLSEASSSGVRMVCGLSQGKYRIVRDARGARFAVRNSRGTTIVGDTPGNVQTAPGVEVVDYAEMVARLMRASHAAGEGR